MRRPPRAATWLSAALLAAAALPAGRSRAHPADASECATCVTIKDDGRIEQSLFLPMDFVMGRVFAGLAPEQVAAMKPEEARERIAAWVRDQGVIEADGIVLYGEVRTVKFSSQDQGPMEFPPGPADAARLVGHGRMQVDILFAAQAPPRRLRIAWSDYPRLPPELADAPVTMTLFILADQSRVSALRATDPEYLWQAEGPPRLAVPATGPLQGKVVQVPLAAIALLAGAAVLAAWGRRRRRWLGLAAAGFAVAGLCAWRGWGAWALATGPKLPAPPAAPEPVVKGLLTGVYQAVGRRDDEQVYQALAACADGPVLPALYTQAHEALRIDDSQGGGFCVVDGVDLRRVAVVPVPAGAEAGAFAVRLDWVVHGRLAHFGHTHAVDPAFSGRWVVAPRPAADGTWTWKIVACELDGAAADATTAGKTGQ